MIAGKSDFCVSISGDILTVSTRGKIEKFDGNGISALSGRGEIGGFSASSRYRMRRYLRETETEYRTFITVTYPADIGQNDSKSSKNDLRVFIQLLKRNVEARGQDRAFSAFWFLEFQKRGAIHYHLFCTHGFDIEWLRCAWADCAVRRFPDKVPLRGNTLALWRAAYASGSSIESIREGRDGIAAYAAKYASKFDQKLIPVDFFPGGVGRFWGVCGRGKRLSASTRVMESVKNAEITVLWRETWDRGMKRGLYSGSLVDISSKIEDLPAGMYVFKVLERERARKIADFIKKWDVLNAILEGRNHCFHMTDDEMERHYREFSEIKIMRDWGFCA